MIGIDNRVTWSDDVGRKGPRQFVDDHISAGRQLLQELRFWGCSSDDPILHAASHTSRHPNDQGPVGRPRDTWDAYANGWHFRLVASLCPPPETVRN